MLTFYSMCRHVCQVASVVSNFATLWTVTHQAPLSMGFSRQEYCSGLSSPPLGDLPSPGIQPTSLVSYTGRWILYRYATWEALLWHILPHMAKGMTSLTRWTWVWANSRRWWRTGQPGALAAHGGHRVLDMTEWLNRNKWLKGLSPLFPSKWNYLSKLTTNL